jgi:hypothetical protein
MSVHQVGVRIATAIVLREAALALLKRVGERTEDKREVWFERHTPLNPEPRLSACLSHYPYGHASLNLWATCNDKHLKVLNIAWIGDTVTLITFRRGEWERELMVMSPSSRSIS